MRSRTTGRGTFFSRGNTPRHACRKRPDVAPAAVPAARWCRRRSRAPAGGPATAPAGSPRGAGSDRSMACSGSPWVGLPPRRADGRARRAGRLSGAARQSCPAEQAPCLPALGCIRAIRHRLGCPRVPRPAWSVRPPRAVRCPCRRGGPATRRGGRRPGPGPGRGRTARGRCRSGHRRPRRFRSR